MPGFNNLSLCQDHLRWLSKLLRGVFISIFFLISFLIKFSKKWPPNPTKSISWKLYRKMRKIHLPVVCLHSETLQSLNFSVSLFIFCLTLLLFPSCSCFHYLSLVPLLLYSLRLQKWWFCLCGYFFLHGMF